MAVWHIVCCTYRCTHASCLLLKLLVDKTMESSYELCFEAYSIEIENRHSLDVRNYLCSCAHRRILRRDHETSCVELTIQHFGGVSFVSSPFRLQATSTTSVLQSSRPTKVTIHWFAYRSSPNPFSQSSLPILSPNPTTCFESSRARQDMSDFNITACGRSVAVRHTVLAATEPRIEIRLDYNQCRLRTYKLDDVS
jgi:hypothetical protein